MVLQTFRAADPAVGRAWHMTDGAAGSWTATVQEVELDGAELYGFLVDGVGPLLDPYATQVRTTPVGARSVLPKPWPVGERGPTVVPVVYEAHVRGMTRSPTSGVGPPEAGTLAGFRRKLPYLADLGITVIELMPVHPFDPTRNYWGYMPLVWGAVHEPFASGDDPARELADFVADAHRHGVAVWLDVVFNHTAEEGRAGITSSLRGIDDAHAYLFDEHGEYNDDSGCGNVVNPADEEIRRLVLDALERFAAMGVDGFRFDLATLLTRNHSDLVHRIGDWAAERGVVLVAEPWDLGSYQLGQWFPDQRWLQWNDRFRDEVRSYLRSEPGHVAAVAQRVQGSPDIFPDLPAGGGPGQSVNFLAVHDGLTLHDLTACTSDRHRSWDCGDELRPRQLRNAFCLVLLSRGTPHFVMGDEFARTQHGEDNPYDRDDELTWLDWRRLDRHRDLHRFVRELLRLRRESPIGAVSVHGVGPEPDLSHASRSLAWATRDLYVMSNTWWEPLTFEVQAPGPWRRVVDTSLPTPNDIVALDVARGVGSQVTLAPRSTVVLRRPTM